MKRTLWLCMVAALCFTSGFAQQTPSKASSIAVPHLVQFSGVVRDNSAQPLTGMVGITFAFYAEQEGGAALWMETQNVVLESGGKYAVQLGATNANGLPTDLFTSGVARWLDVRVNGGDEQPRVLLLSVPYALKAGDAETIGGLPPTAFVLAAPASGTMVSESAPVLSGTAVTALQPPATGNTPVTTAGGSTGKIPVWDSTSDITSSVMSQSTINSVPQISVNGTLALPNNGAATKTSGKKSRPLTLTASAFNSTTNSAVNQVFQWQSEPAGNNTATPSGSLNLLFGSGSTTPGETGLKISSKGLFTFATGQTFPGTGKGTVTSVGSGKGLKGGPITGSGTLSVDPTIVAELNVANVFAQPQTIDSTLTGNLLAVKSASVNQFSVDNFGNIFNNGVIVAGNDINTNGSVFSAGLRVDGLALLDNYPGTNVATLSVTGSSAFTGSASDAAPAISAIGGNASIDGSFNPGKAGAGIMAAGGAGYVGHFGDLGSAPGGAFTGGNSSDCGALSGTCGGDGIIAMPGQGVDGLPSGFAGNFVGDVGISGTLRAEAKFFKIDHPLNPAKQYLVHASVESSEMMNIYTGNVTTDGEGEATVLLPEWFEALNTDFRYQLTVIGQFAQAIIAREISNHQFTIRSTVPNTKVSWQVTGVRQDPYAKANPLVVETQKNARETGYYLHPELYGAPEQKQIEWARHPDLMNRIQQMREQQTKLQRMRAKSAIPGTSATPYKK